MRMAGVSGHRTHPSGPTAREPGQSAKETGPRFDVLLLEHGNYCPLGDSSLPDVYWQGMSPSPPGTMILKGPQMMA